MKLQNFAQICKVDLVQIVQFLKKQLKLNFLEILLFKYVAISAIKI